MEKIKKLKGYFGDVIGYKLGNYYLMKVYTWKNQYEWIITTKEYKDDLSFTCTRDRLYNEGLIEYVGGCTYGKQKLIEYYNKGE